MKIKALNGRDKNTFKTIIPVFIIIVYVGIILGFASLFYHLISNEIQKELGEKAKILAIDIAQRIKMEPAEFDRLLSLEFNALLMDPANVDFEKKARAVMKHTDIKYIYLETRLPADRIKYHVSSEETAHYDVPAGTPLNVVYLLDAVINVQTRWEDTNNQWYTDKDRYTVMSDTFNRAYASRQPTTHLNADEWGTYITGYAPCFDTDGNYCGLIGVDLFLDNYLSHLYQYLSIIGGFVLTLIAIGLFTFRQTSRARKAAETLRQSEKKHRNLFETMAQGVVYQDADGTIISVNPAAEHILGYTLEEMKGLKSTDTRWNAVREDGSDFPGNEHPAMIALQTGKRIGGVIMGVYHPPSAERRWIKIDALPEFLPGATNPYQVYSIFEDITDRRQAGEALRNRHQKLEQIFEGLPVALVFVDENRRIVRVNQTFASIFGYQPEEVLGQKTALLYARIETFEEKGRNVFNAHAFPEDSPCEVDYRRASGEIFKGETVGAPVHDSNGNVLGMLALIRDLSRENAIESALQPVFDIRAGRTGGNGFPHDFHNLMTIILGYGELVLEELHLPPESR